MEMPGRTPGPRAGFGSRLVAAFVDVVIVGLANTVLLQLLGENLTLAYAVTTLTGISYYTVLEGGPRGQTLGKRLLGIRVIDFRSGGPIGFARGAFRYLARILSALPLFLGYFWMLWDNESQTWHDKLVSTLVVPVSAFPVEE